MRPFTSTISLEEAHRALSEAVEPISRTERVRLADAAGRVVAREIVSPIEVPPFARSTMDGYAVRSSDVGGARRDRPAFLRIVERIYTGQPPTVAIGAGPCAE